MKKKQQEALLIPQIYHSETFSLLAHRWHLLLWQSNLDWQCVVPSSATQRAVLLTGPYKNDSQAKLMPAVHSRHLKFKAIQSTVNSGGATSPSFINFASQPTQKNKKFPSGIQFIIPWLKYIAFTRRCMPSPILGIKTLDDKCQH